MLLSDWVLIAALVVMAASTLLPSLRERAGVWWWGATCVAFGAAVVSYLLYRWQVVPALVLLLASSVSVACFSRWRYKLGPRTIRLIRMTGIVLLLAGIGLSAIVLQQLPVYSLPAPRGEWRVGVTDFEVVDRPRQEPFSDEPSDVRRLMVRVWYPADRVDGHTLRPYRTRREADVISRNMAGTLRMPPYFFRHLRGVRTHAYLDAEISGRQSKYPAVVFSHGYLGTVEMHSALMESLASHGYIMLSVAHPHESAAVFYPNGEVVGLHPRVIAQMSTRSIDADARTIIASEDIGARFASTQRLYAKDTPLGRSSPVWRDDMISVVNAVAARAVDPTARSIIERIDLQRLAYAGMSFGGAAAANACHVDMRCRAAVNLDGRENTLDLFDRQIRTPLLMLSQGAQELVAGLRYNDFHYERAAQAGQRSDVLRYIVGGSGHWDFSDHTLLARWPARELVLFPSVMGEGSGASMAMLIDDAVRGFLDQYVAGVQGHPMSAVLKAHPELEAQDLSRIRNWAARDRHE